MTREDSIQIHGIQFGHNGQLLATGASDGRIRVCSLFSRNGYVNHYHSNLPRYVISP